jgi:hypothetical protein
MAANDSSIELTFRTRAGQSIPVVHAVVKRKTDDFVLHAERSSISRPEIIKPPFLPFDEWETLPFTGWIISPALLRLVTSAFCIGSAALTPVLLCTKWAAASERKRRKGPRPVVEVAAFVTGVKQTDPEDTVNTPGSFPQVGQS